MSNTHNKLQYGNNSNHCTILDLALDLNYFSNPTHLYLNTKPRALIISFLSVFDMLHNVALGIRTWREVRNFA